MQNNKKELFFILLTGLALIFIYLFSGKIKPDEISSWLFDENRSSGYLYVLDEHQSQLEIIDTLNYVSIGKEPLKVIPDFWAFQDGLFYYGQKNKKALFILNLKNKEQQEMSLNFELSGLKLGKKDLYLWGGKNWQTFNLTTAKLSEIVQHQEIIEEINEFFDQIIWRTEKNLMVGRNNQIQSLDFDFKITGSAFSPNGELLITGENQIGIYPNISSDFQAMAFQEALQPYANNRGSEFYFVNKMGNVFHWQKNMKRFDFKILDFSLAFLDKYLILFGENKLMILEAMGLKTVGELPLMAPIKSSFLSANSKNIYFIQGQTISVLNLPENQIKNLPSQTENPKALFMGSTYTICH